mgnify:FL=1
MALIGNLLVALGAGLVAYAFVRYVDRRLRRVEAGFEVLRISTPKVLEVMEQTVKDSTRARLQ